MVRDLRGRGASSFILYLFRPLRHLFSRFALLLFVLLSFGLIFLSKTNHTVTQKISTEITDVAANVSGVALKPVDWLSGATKGVEKYLFVYSKNETLRQENRELQNRLSLLAQVELENRRLRQLLHFVQEPSYRFISARVVGDTSGAFIRSLLIDAGKWDGVKEGQAVVNEQGVVGRVIEVGDHSARVLLLTDINSRVPVISAESGIRCIVAGNNQEHPELTYLLDESNIKSGEHVVTSGDGELFPPGLEVGKVYKSPNDGKFYVQPFAQWNKLQFVSVLDYHYTSKAKKPGDDKEDEPVTVP